MFNFVNTVGYVCAMIVSSTKVFLVVIFSRNNDVDKFIFAQEDIWKVRLLDSYKAEASFCKNGHLKKCEKKQFMGTGPPYTTKHSLLNLRTACDSLQISNTLLNQRSLKILQGSGISKQWTTTNLTHNVIRPWLICSDYTKYQR